MSNYEFWDDLGKIFNAVVSYQEKTIEFNKRFINPWIRLGNVFDKQDRNKEAISAYEKAIEIDPTNAQNWYELGNIHFRMENHAEAIDAFNKAIELDPNFGWPYSNLALTLVSQSKYVQAIPLYRKAIELLEEDKDKAVAWNRLGNVYRKLNEYALAVEAFQKADELDQENAGFRDSLDEVSEGPSVIEASSGENASEATAVTVSPIELILADSQAEEAASQNSETTASNSSASNSEIPTMPVKAAAKEVASAPLLEPSTESESTASNSQPAAVVEAAAATPTSAVSDAPVAMGTASPPEAKESASNAEQSAEAAPEAAAATEGEKQASSSEQTVTVVVQSTVETYTESVTVTDTVTETTGEIDAEAEEVAAENPEQNTEAVPEAVEEITEEAVGKEVAEITAPSSEVQAEANEAVSEAVGVTHEIVEASNDEENSEVATPELVAYEEYLKDNNEPLSILAAEPAKETTGNENEPASAEPVAKLDPSGELQIEMDTKNAHVWNELGNVYYNTGAFDDAIIAYSKAIELDRWFAWPYSNLALAYVQKARFVEAILLYQRSIELFAGEKDKAISWNRLGNVYRRLNDYENAIAAYQRADELDPDNTTLSLQSRFSLLGSFSMEQKPSYIS